MIDRIAGTLDRVDPLSAVLALPHGMWYELLIPAFLAPQLQPRLGSTITLYTHHYFDSPNQGATLVPRLVGFASAHDRDFFLLFTTVKGIGNKKALRAMAHPPALIARAIVARDPKALAQLPEVGKRLAETIIAELHGKVESYLTSDELATLDRAATNTPTTPTNPVTDEAIAALIALGESPASAQSKVERALARGIRATTAGDLVAAVFAAAPR